MLKVSDGSRSCTNVAIEEIKYRKHLRSPTRVKIVVRRSRKNTKLEGFNVSPLRAKLTQIFRQNEGQVYLYPIIH
jgi:hypothetical protein